MLRYIRVLSTVSALVLVYALNATVAWVILAGMFLYVVGRHGRRFLGTVTLN